MPEEVPHDPVVVLDRRHLHVTRHGEHDAPGAPVVLVPPPAAPSSCYHLRDGLSVRDHLVAAGHPVYAVDLGPITRADRDLGFGRVVDTIVPGAVRAAAEDAGRDAVVLGWSIAGTLTLFSLAAHADLPVVAAVVVGSPFDYGAMPLLRPVQLAGRVTGGRIVRTAVGLAGVLPAPLVRTTYRLSAVTRELARPAWVLRQRLAGNDERLAHSAAVERFTRTMPAYPGAFFVRLWSDLMVRNRVAEGRLRIGGREVDLAELRDVPVLAVAGTDDTITPVAAARHVTALCGGTEVRFATAPGSHLGVLTGTTAPETTWRLVDDFLAEHAAARAG